MQEIMPFKIAVEQHKETTYGGVILRPQDKINGYGTVKQMGVMAKKLFPELSIGDTVWCDYQSTCVVDGLNVISVFDVKMIKKK